MAINKKGSRNISVEEHQFRWRATGNDGWINITVWPIMNENSRAVATIGYHHDMKKVREGQFSSESQLIVTNRIVRELILHVGTKTLLENNGQIDVGSIEDIYDITQAVRS